MQFAEKGKRRGGGEARVIGLHLGENLFFVLWKRTATKAEKAKNVIAGDVSMNECRFCSPSSGVLVHNKSSLSYTKTREGGENVEQVIPHEIAGNNCVFLYSL